MPGHEASGHRRDDTESTTPIPRNRNREDREYLDKYTVQAALASAVEHILQTRPSDPFSAISELFFSRLPPSVLAPGETTVGALHAEALPGGALESRLVRLGLDASRASGFAAAAKRLIDAGISPSTRASAFWVPGRIEVAGKHTDYAGGRSLLCAANRGFAVVSAEREDAVCRIFATFELTGEQAEAEVRLDASAGEPLPEGWALYPAVTARRLARALVRPCGGVRHVVVIGGHHSDVPGPRSS